MFTLSQTVMCCDELLCTLVMYFTVQWCTQLYTVMLVTVTLHGAHLQYCTLTVM